MVNELKGAEPKIDFIAVAAEAESEEEAKLLLSREFKNMVQTMPPEEIAAWVTKFAAIVRGGWHYHIELDIPFGRSD